MDVERNLIWVLAITVISTLFFLQLRDYLRERQQARLSPSEKAKRIHVTIGDLKFSLYDLETFQPRRNLYETGRRMAHGRPQLVITTPELTQISVWLKSLFTIPETRFCLNFPKCGNLIVPFEIRQRITMNPPLLKLCLALSKAPPSIPIRFLCCHCIGEIIQDEVTEKATLEALMYMTFTHREELDRRNQTLKAGMQTLFSER